MKRQLFVDDFDLKEYEENADGPIEFRMASGLVLHFVAETEAFSVGVVAGEMNLYGESYVQRDVSENEFWCARIGADIIRIDLLQSPDRSADYPCEFGVLFTFQNEKQALIEYIDDEDNLDLIRVTRHNTYKHYCSQSIEGVLGREN